MQSNPTSESQVPAAPLRLLLVEDDVVDRMALLRFVETERLAYTVQVATSVAEARQALKTQAFDIVLLDRALQDGTGFDLLEAVGRTPVIFVTGADSPEIAVEAMKRGASDYLLKDQERRYLRLLPVAVERALKRAREEHERHEFQSRMQRSQKMEAIGTLAGGIAHEFNNILAIILSYAELSKLECDACPALVPNLDEVIKAAWRAKDVVQQIQTFNLEHSGDRAPVKVEPVVQDVCQLLRNAIPRGIQIETDGVSVHAVIVANRGQIRQALMNVCNNARQALPATGGRIQIRTHTVTVESANVSEHGDLPPGRYVRLSVQDNGCGMDEATLARVVEPFFTTRPPGQGSGLGMSAVLGIMRAHGGNVTLSSKSGGGTTVHLYFPTTLATSGETKSSDCPLPADNTTAADHAGG
ncbi:MAG: ATP-binding protein [Verrucomicrobiota bacterium]